MSAPAPDNLVQNVNTAFPLEKWRDVRTLIAVSGGPDSIALLHAMSEIARAGGEGRPLSNLMVAHVNHGMRGPDSQADETFVRETAGELNLSFHCRIGISESRSEESLRDLRYKNLREMAGETGARYLVTGHNQEDQVETILFRIFRGTGIRGLAGIPSTRVVDDYLTVVRPLLKVSRHEILKFLEARGLRFRLDASNQASEYTRNFIRHEVIPLIKTRFENSLDGSVLRLSEQASEVDREILNMAQQLNEAVLARQPRLVIDCRKLALCSQVTVKRWLVELWETQSWASQSMTFHWWNRIAELLMDLNANGKIQLPGGVMLEKSEEIATLLPARQNPTPDNDGKDARL